MWSVVPFGNAGIGIVTYAYYVPFLNCESAVINIRVKLTSVLYVSESKNLGLPHGLRYQYVPQARSYHRPLALTRTQELPRPCTTA